MATWSRSLRRRRLEAGQDRCRDTRGLHFVGDAGCVAVGIRCGLDAFGDIGVVAWAGDFAVGPLVLISHDLERSHASALLDVSGGLESLHVMANRGDLPIERDGDVFQGGAPALMPLHVVDHGSEDGERLRGDFHGVKKSLTRVLTLPLLTS